MERQVRISEAEHQARCQVQAEALERQRIEGQYTCSATNYAECRETPGTACALTEGCPLPPRNQYTAQIHKRINESLQGRKRLAPMEVVGETDARRRSDVIALGGGSYGIWETISTGGAVLRPVRVVDDSTAEVVARLVSGRWIAPDDDADTRVLIAESTAIGSLMRARIALERLGATIREAMSNALTPRQD
jgi:hypothetical protein